MALLLERSIIDFPKCYKFIIVVILLMVHNQGTNSSKVNLKVSAYIGNNTIKSDYISDVFRRYKRQNINSGVNCELPSHPPHGRYAILGDSVTNYKPGDFANQFRNLVIHCNGGYGINPFERNFVICINGTWNPKPTNCLRTCPSLRSTETTIVECSLNRKPLENCINPVMGTRAKLSCTTFYEDHSIQRSPLRVCRANGWYPSTATCFPSCGNKNSKGNPNIIGGQNVTIGDYPWQIGIYDSTTKAFICGGSIIEQNIILTAAHCVTDYQGVVEPAGQYSVAAGKYFSRYDEPRDLFAQYSKVLSIYVPKRYTGRINAFALDIAVLILEMQFTLSPSVQPICIDLNDDPINENFLSASDNGIVTGWGYTVENGEISDVLKEVIIPLIPPQKCSSELPQTFRGYFTFDKICGGYLNNRTSICSGDSGGALVFQNVINNKYYAIGIVSTSPASEALTCDPNQYSLFTSVDQHVNFVRELVADNQLRTSIECSGDNCQIEENRFSFSNQKRNQETTSSNNCQIPNFGPHVKYTILGVSGNAYQNPGDDVQQLETLEISCDTGYKLNVFSDFRTTCFNGKWLPSPTLRCLKTCPSLNSTTSTRVSCYYNHTLLKNCQSPIDQTEARLSCNPLYEEEAFIKHITRTCKAGRWIPAISECRPICGVKRPKGRPNIINGLNATMGDYPWHVGIYNLRKEFLCSGSILDRHIILTAAHCFTYYDGLPKPLENFLIAAGKYYREYDDHRDTFAQYSKILHIRKRIIYRGHPTLNAVDILIIVLTDPFTLTEAVQPVCIELNELSPALHLSPNSSGIVTGWGYTKESTKLLSDVLKELVVPIIPSDKCFAGVSDDIDPYFISDKICAGYLNNGTAICNGDAGGALVFKNTLNERYYIEGIASTKSLATEEEICDSNKSSVFTSIKSWEHINFIRRCLAEFQIPQSIEFVPSEATN